MTWYASQIMTTGAASMLAAMESAELPQSQLFRVSNPLEHNWHTPQVRHSVPGDGLVFIRPICDQTDDIAEWHDNGILTWDQFKDLPGEDVILTPRTIAAHCRETDIATLVAIDVLRVAKKLSIDAGHPVAFYYCFCWGGDVEVEFAWIFDEKERVLIKANEEGADAPNRFLEVDCNATTVRDGDVLVRTLHALACELPTPYFAPHTRSFPWEQHRL